MSFHTYFDDSFDVDQKFYQLQIWK